MTEKTWKRLRIGLYTVLFLAALFAVLHVAFWAKKGDIAGKPAPKGEPNAPAKTEQDGRPPAPAPAQ